MENRLIHLGLIMDGNRRWAKEKGLPSLIGHKQGAETLINIAKYCNKKGIKFLTVYAFSTENWKRTKEEVGYLMKLFESYLNDFLERLGEENIKINFLGTKENLDKKLITKMEEVEESTKNNTGLNLMVAFNYGGRLEIVDTVKKISTLVKDGDLKIEDITEELFNQNLYTEGKEDIDLIVRTSGEMRTSNFLPWQSIYAEFLPTEKYWPDFNEKDIDFCIETFSKRQIRKGK